MSSFVCLESHPLVLNMVTPALKRLLKSLKQCGWLRSTWKIFKVFNFSNFGWIGRFTNAQNRSARGAFKTETCTLAIAQSFKPFSANTESSQKVSEGSEIFWVVAEDLEHYSF